MTFISDFSLDKFAPWQAKNLEYITILVDNYGSRASWIGGQTPQVQWPNGKRQGESLDIVKALESQLLWRCIFNSKATAFLMLHGERKMWK